MFGDQATEPRVLVAIPALNEALSLPHVVREVRAANPSVDVLVVDDGSTDQTVAVAKGLGVALCQLPFNLGVGGAMRTAFKFAQRNDYDVVVQVDADGQHDPAQLQLLIAGLQDADVVVGARFAGEGRFDVAPGRRIAMRLLATFVSRMAGGSLTDVTSGFRATGRRGIEVFSLHYPSEYLGDTVESLVIALRTGCVVKQVPVSMRQRALGRPSQSSVKATVYLFRAIAALLLAVVRQWPVPEVAWTSKGAALRQTP